MGVLVMEYCGQVGSPLLVSVRTCGGKHAGQAFACEVRVAVTVAGHPPPGVGHRQAQAAELDDELLELLEREELLDRDELLDREELLEREDELDRLLDELLDRRLLLLEERL